MSWIGRPEWPSERLWLWRTAFPLLRAVVKMVVPIHLEGRERIPAGPFILAANHTSWLDPPAIEFALAIPIRYMGKRELFEWPVVGGVLRGIGVFPVRRGEIDRSALETALRVLDAGQVLGYFPEGHRSDDGQLQRGRRGIGFLVRRSGALVVPVAVLGTRSFALRIPVRSEITVRVGEPFRPSAEADLERGDQMIADAIMGRIAALLPNEMKGVYG